MSFGTLGSEFVLQHVQIWVGSSHEVNCKQAIVNI